MAIYFIDSFEWATPELFWNSPSRKESPKNRDGMITHCYCRCHNEDLANRKELNQFSEYGAYRFETPVIRVISDPLAAVLACNSCVNNHAQILLLRRDNTDEPYPYNFDDSEKYVDTNNGKMPQ